MPVEAEEQEDYTVVADSWLAEIRQVLLKNKTQYLLTPTVLTFILMLRVLSECSLSAH